jgi:hypothetical protein
VGIKVIDRDQASSLKVTGQQSRGRLRHHKQNPAAAAFLQTLLIMLRFCLQSRTAAKRASGSCDDGKMRIGCYGNHASLVKLFAEGPYGRLGSSII